jgi:hypothetical protein
MNVALISIGLRDNNHPQFKHFLRDMESENGREFCYMQEHDVMLYAFLNCSPEPKYVTAQGQILDLGHCPQELKTILFIFLGV